MILVLHVLLVKEIIETMISPVVTVLQDTMMMDLMQIVYNVLTNVRPVLIPLEHVQLVKVMIETMISLIVLVLKDSLMMVSMLIVLLAIINVPLVLVQLPTALLVLMEIELLHIIQNVTVIVQDIMIKVIAILFVQLVITNV